MFKVLGVGGSMRNGSHSTHMVNLILKATEERGAEVRLLDLRVVDLPMFRPRELSDSPRVAEAKEAFLWADAFVIASPDYHGSMSGALKNFLDYHWAEFAGKLFGYVCASHEKGLTVMEQMRTAVRQCYGWSLPYGVSFNGDTDFNTSGEITNAQVAHRVRMVSRDIIAYGKAIRDQFVSDIGNNVEDSFASRYRS